MEEIKKEADRIFEEFYDIIFNFNATDETLQLRAKECALICLDEKYTALREQLFNLRACKVIQSPNTYLERLRELDNKQMKLIEYIKDNY